MLDKNPLFILPKVVECTQTEDAFTGTPETSESTPRNSDETTELKVENVLSTSSHSTKSTGDKSVDSGADASLPKDEKPTQIVNDSNDAPSVDGVSKDVTNATLANEETMNDEDSVTPEIENEHFSAQEDYHDHDEWATVEVRTRGNRKKPNERNNSNGRFGAAQNGNNSKKKAPRNPETRKRSQRRKMARDILLAVLDTVHDQVMKRSQQPQNRQSQPSGPRTVPNAWGTMQTKKSTAAFESATNQHLNQHQGSSTREGTTLRNILMGKSDDSTKALYGASQREQTEPPRQQSLKMDRGNATIAGADQNTAPTLTETLSSVSAVTEVRSMKNLRDTSGVLPGDSSSNESINATKPQNNSNQSQETQVSPPLPTLLSPGNSATSSVASSLEAPHAVHHNHLSYVGNENDVGYHLLHVCDRLTRDIGIFMNRREEALKLRRQERKLVLSALQDSLTVSFVCQNAGYSNDSRLTLCRQTIWPGGCKVQMYGSCATDLDLPSSDLDVVVCGLDQSELAAMVAHSQGIPLSPSKSDLREGEREFVHSDKTEDNRLKHPSEKPTCSDGTLPQYQLSYKPTTTNAERVVLLALELERQPWAVHVKAIPTATVPVIKILADPARFQGMAQTNGEWLAHQTHSIPVASSSSEPNENTAPYHIAPTLMPWRGADVVNGLLSVDITFEGPEHGGIGSTIFSTRVVDEFSRESGLPADSTAPVQVLMVLKELLAQRRLNEPFSGGLSSYALLLLVISIVREREIIRKELELVERQRKLVAAGGGNAVPHDPPQQTVGNQKNGKASKAITRTQDHKRGKEGWGHAVTAKSATPSFPSKNDKAKRQDKSEGKDKGGDPINKDGLQRGVPTSSSWASIAGKSSSPNLSIIQDVGYSDFTAYGKTPTPTKTGSFADAAAKGTNAVANTESKKKRTKTSESNKGKTKATESKQPIGAELGSGRKMHSMEESQRKTIASKLPATASIFEPNSSPSHNGSIPTKPNTSMADESGSFFPQSFHDVIEVLCSGETTPGKLLMHFLLFYGQHFDSHSTAIDYSDTHKRDPNANNGYAVASPYMQRRNTGFYDQVTGMFTVDPIVIFDPLVGAETNNVARSCFAWSSIRWVFAQSYMTLSSAVEMSAGHLPEQGHQTTKSVNQDPSTGERGSISSRHQDATWWVPYRHDESGNVIFDPKTPLLELLLSF